MSSYSAQIWKPFEKKKKHQKKTSKFFLIGNKYLHPQTFLQKCFSTDDNYRKTSNISHTLIDNKSVDHSKYSWSNAFLRCSNYIFILNLTH